MRKPIIEIADPLFEPLAHAVRTSQTGYVIEYRGKPVKSIRTSFRQACKRAGLGVVTPRVLQQGSASSAQ